MTRKNLELITNYKKKNKKIGRISYKQFLSLNSKDLSLMLFNVGLVMNYLKNTFDTNNLTVIFLI